MRKFSIAALFICAAFIFNALTLQCFGDEYVKNEERQFKVIGYYSGDLFDEPLEKLQTKKLTHVIYAFLIPRADGSLVDIEKEDNLRAVVEQAHSDGAKVFIALGGWSYEGLPLEPVFREAASNEDTRRLLVENVCAFVEKYNLDGVEIDWEHPNASTVKIYEALVKELGEALKGMEKEFTAALNGAWSSAQGPEPSMVVSDECLKYFDFINVMAYDMNNAAHSPVWFSETSIEFWLKRGIGAENIVLGMPLYAKPSFRQYRHLVEMNPEYAYIDFVPTTPMESNYNGMNTLREKTIVAMNKAGGVMLFDVNEDTNDETSIVSMIDDLLSARGHLSEKELRAYITVVLNNKELVFSESENLGVPFVDENNRTLVPLRKPLEAIDAKIGYDELNRSVTVEKDGTIVTIPIDRNIITVNGKDVAMDAKAIIKNSRTYVPLRFVFEAFGYDVQWSGSSSKIIRASESIN